MSSKPQVFKSIDKFLKDNPPALIIPRSKKDIKMARLFEELINYEWKMSQPMRSNFFNLVKDSYFPKV